ncbi:MAG: hypothetical protein OEX97_06860 [Acidimicrobiia bacterium]|nr:hypothetical protein [Acidimicrobiia bacterium]
MTGRVLLGPFLTRAEAARRGGLSAMTIHHRPDLLRVGGRTFKEAYFAFQFDRGGVRRDVGSVVLTLRPHFDDVTIADWLVMRTPVLSGYSPLAWLIRGGDLEAVLRAASVPDSMPSSLEAGPEVEPSRSISPSRSERVGRTGRLSRPRIPRPITGH